MLGHRRFRQVRTGVMGRRRTHHRTRPGRCGHPGDLTGPDHPCLLGRPASINRLCLASNDSIADAVRRSRGRLEGLATLPLPHVAAAVTELHRVVTELGLRGIEIGSQVTDWDLDSAELAPVFAAAEELDAVVFVHPTDGGDGVLRRSGQPYDFGLGMITDTAIAATALVRC